MMQEEIAALLGKFIFYWLCQGEAVHSIHQRPYKLESHFILCLYSHGVQSNRGGQEKWLFKVIYMWRNGQL